MIDVLNSFLIAFRDVDLYIHFVSFAVVCWLFRCVYSLIEHNFNV